MTFLRPDWLHLFWLAAPIVAFYLVRRRARATEVSSLILWQKVLAAESRRPWWGRLRDAGSLLLNLLVLAGLALAAAGPERVVAGPASETWAVVLDAGVTMRTEVKPGRTRLDRGKEVVREILARLAPRDRALVVAAGPSPMLLAVPGEAGDTLLAVVDEVVASAAPSDLAAAVSFARRAAGDEPDRLLVVGDRDPADPGAGFVSVAPEGTANAGFTDVDARRDPVSLVTVVTCRVAASGPGEIRREVVLRGPAGHIETADVTLADGGSRELSFAFEPGAAGRAEIALRPGDAYPTDDRVAIPVEPPPRLRLLVVGTLDPFLESALRAQGDRVDRARSAVVDLASLPAEVPPDAVLVLVGRECPPTVRRGNVWVLDAPDGTVREAPAITDWSTDHPVTRGLDLGNLGLKRARPTEPGPDDRALVSAEGGAVITVREEESRRILRIAFAFPDGNLPVLAAFPLLVRNALAWFAGLEERSFPPAVRAGEPLEPRRRLARAIARVHLSGPAVEGIVEVPVRDGRIAWRLPAVATSGVLVARAGARAETIAINPITREILAVPGAIGGLEVEDLPRRLARPDPPRRLLPYLLAAIGGLLFLEWWHHQRGRRLHFD